MVEAAREGGGEQWVYRDSVLSDQFCCELQPTLTNKVLFCFFKVV